jgi:hypothetical protein
MTHLLFTLLCRAVLSAVTGCYVDPALSGSSSVEVGVGAYVEEPYYWGYYPRRYYWYDDWRYRRPYPPYPYRYRPYPYYGR